MCTECQCTRDCANVCKAHIDMFQLSVMECALCKKLSFQPYKKICTELKAAIVDLCMKLRNFSLPASGNVQ